MGRNKGSLSPPRTLESFMMVKGKQGDVFYSKRHDSMIQTVSIYYERKVTTERVLVVADNKKVPTVDRLTKVTLIN